MKDIVARTVRTYVQVLIGLVLAAWGTDFNLSTLKALALAAVPAALAALQNALEVKTPVNLGPRG